jgi:hypothetical protein
VRLGPIQVAGKTRELAGKFLDKLSLKVCGPSKLTLGKDGPHEFLKVSDAGKGIESLPLEH